MAPADASQITLYHCEQARSFRVLWAMHEMGLEGYTLVTMPFPPRVMAKEYMKVNKLGTIPYFVHGETRMTESCGIPMYLVERFGPSPLQVRAEEPGFGEYLNWIAHADATLTFPQTVFLRFVLQEPKKGLGEAGAAYAKWFMARLRFLDDALEDGREFLCSGRLTIADICVTYALLLGQTVGIAASFGPYKPKTAAYLDRMCARPAFAAARAEEQASLAAWHDGRSKL